MEVKEEDVFDYIRYYADGHQEGNTTGEIIKHMEEQEEGKTILLVVEESRFCRSQMRQGGSWSKGFYALTDECHKSVMVIGSNRGRSNQNESTQQSS